MNKEEKEAIEYLKVRLYGNEGCKYIDVAQEDLRIFLKLVTRKEKELENWKKYCDKQEENITEKSNKICDLEFKIENQQAELEKKDKESHFIQSELDIANAKIIKLNKMIDLMAEYINDIDVTEDLCEEVVCEEQNECKECIKQHFENEVNSSEQN